MWTALLVSFGVIFIAELGDKSQLMALTFATRCPAVPVLIGITIATALVHAVSVIVGGVLGAALPTDVINLVAAVSFVGFGLWTLRGDRLTDEDEERAARPARNTILAVGTVFFLAELGDKTQLAAITMSASTRRPVSVFIGASLALAAVSAVGVAVGAGLSEIIPMPIVRKVAAAAFVIIGVAMLLDWI